MPDGKAVIVVPGDEPIQIAGSRHLEKLKPYGQVTLFDTRPQSPEEQVERVKDAEVIMNTRGSVKWGEAEFCQLPNLKMVTTCSIGTDMIDLVAARNHGVIVCNQPGRTAPVVAEHMFGLMFAISKRAAYFTAQMKAGNWPRKDNMMLQGKTLGIVGTGNIGAEMARLAKALGMKVIAWTFHPSAERAEALGVRFVELDELLQTADVVSVHVALTEDTTGLIGERAFNKMRPGTLFLNGARGAVVDTTALVAALNSGHLGGAAVDVFEQEPPPADLALLKCEQVVLTPHCADMTPEGVDLLNSGAVENAIAFFENRIQNTVT